MVTKKLKFIWRKFIYYSSEVLHNFGMRNDEPEYVTIGIGLCMTLGTIIALVVIDSLGPKTLLLISLALLFFATTALSIVFQLTVSTAVGLVFASLFYR